MFKKFSIAAVLVFLLVLLDQATKMWAVATLKGIEGISLIDGVFRFMYLENRGSAFSMFQNQTTGFIIFTLIVLVVIAFLYARIPDTRHMLPLKILGILIFAGAVGNLIDRVRQAFVVDFLYFELINFPVFNVADIYVTCGSFLFISLGLFYYKDEDLEFLSLRKKKKEQ